MMHGDTKLDKNRISDGVKPMDVITSQELEISTVLDVMSVRIYSMITKTYKLTLVVNIPECENPLGLLQYY